MHTLEQRYDHFCKNIPLNEIPYDGRMWSYYRAGDTSKETVLLLHGNGGNAEAMFPYIDYLSADFDVIAPNIPSGLYSVEIVLEGLAGILDGLDIPKAHLVGLGFGGALAQVLLRRSPARFNDVILTHTVIPSAHLAEVAKMQRWFLLVQPNILVRWFAQRALRGQINQSTSPAQDEVRDFWKKYYNTLYQKQVGKGHLLSRAWIMGDYHSGYTFTSDDLKEWSGSMLIIQSSADEIIAEGDRGSLLGMYPAAYIQTLEGYDHLAPILASDELCTSMHNFLLKARSIRENLNS